jgi:PPM family protein phosphatase
MRAVCLTDRGRVRQHNEDSCGVFTNKDGETLAIVADGMGGHRAGDVASSMTTSKLKSLWEESTSIQSPDMAEKWLEESIHSVNKSLYSYAQENSDCLGMGTTVVAAICTSTFSTIAHIGDSRCYLLNQSGYKQITEDHSLVNELVKSGQISREDAEHHPRKNVLLRALGTEATVEMDIATIVLDDQDKLLICSDGLSNRVSDLLMSETLHRDLDLDMKAKALVDLANENGGEDNITLVIIDYSSLCESG